MDGAPRRRGPARPRFTAIPVAAALAASIGLLILVAVLGVLSMQWSVNRDNTLALLNDKAQLIVERIEAGVRGHLDPAARQAKFLARQIESGAIGLGQRQRLADLLTGSLAAVPQVAAIVTFDRSLEKFGIVRAPGAGPQTIQGTGRANPEIRTAASELAEASGAFWGDVVFDNDNGLTLINLRRPLRRDGEYIGFLVVAITVAELSELVTRTGDLFDATAFVLQGRDHVLAHPFLASARSEQSVAEPLVALNRVGDLVLASLWEGSTLPGFGAAAARSRWSV